MRIYLKRELLEKKDLLNGTRTRNEETRIIRKRKDSLKMKIEPEYELWKSN